MKNLKRIINSNTLYILFVFGICIYAGIVERGRQIRIEKLEQSLFSIAKNSAKVDSALLKFIKEVHSTNELMIFKLHPEFKEYMESEENERTP